MTEPNQLSPDMRERIARSKSLQIDISREQKSNEPNLSLGHLAYLLNSLATAFRVAGEKVNFPRTNSFTLLDGARDSISIQGASFPLVLSSFRLDEARDRINSASGPIAYINSRLYADDVVAILHTSRNFLARWYAQTDQATSWAYSLANISGEISEAQKAGSSQNLQKIATGSLREAVAETAKVVSDLHQSLQEQEVVKTDPIEPLLDQLHTDPIRAWKNQLGALARNLSQANLGDQVVLTDNHSYNVRGVRTLLNQLFDQIQTRLQNLQADDQLNKLSNQLKSLFLHQRTTHCFNSSELAEDTIRAVDRAKAKRFLSLFDQVLKSLGKEIPTSTPDQEAEEAEEDVEGGEETEEEVKKPQALTLDEIRQQLFAYLKNEAWLDFLDYYANLSLEPKAFSKEKKSILQERYQELVTDLLNQFAIKQQLTKHLKSWLKETYEVDSTNSEQTYSVGGAQETGLYKTITNFFFATYSQRFVNIIKEVAELPTETATAADEEQAELERLQGKDHLTHTTLPPQPDLETVAKKADPASARTQSRFVAEATTAFIGLYFPEQKLSRAEEQRLRALIASALTNQLSTVPEERLATGSARGLILNQLFPKVFLDPDFSREFFQLGQNVYNQQLTALGINTEVELLNIYNAVDALIVLLDDPETVIGQQLSDGDLKLNFNLPDDFTEFDQLRQLLKGLVRLRQARQVYHQHLKLTPLLIGDEARQRYLDNQEAYLVPTRVLMKEVGPEAITFFQDRASLDKAQLNDEERQKLSSWRERLWHQTIANLDQETIVQVYAQYQVTVYEINWETLPAPDHFSYIELAQLAGADPSALSPEQTQLAAFANSIFNQGKEAGVDKSLNDRLTGLIGKKGTKALLAAVAPEVLPILNTLEKLPIIGDKLQEQYEKIGKITELGGMVMAGASMLFATFLSWLGRSVGAAIGAATGAAVGAITGGILGSIIPGLGTVVGIIGGGALGGIIGGWIGSSGGMSGALSIGGGSTAATTAATGVGASTSTAGTVAAASRGGASVVAGAANSAGTILAATGATVAVGYVVTTQIQNSAQIRPMSEITRQEDLPGGTYDPGTGEPSLYVDIEKIPQPKKVDDAPVTITYHINIKPKGYDLTITDAKDEVEVFMEGNFTGVAPTLGLEDFPDLEEGLVIDAEEGFEFEYEQTYNSDFQDSMVANTFTLSFDYCPDDGTNEATPSATPEASEEPTEPTDCPSGGGSAEAATIASVVIGDAPTAKEGCWPATGHLTQEPFGTYSHCSKERPWGENKPCIPGTYDDAVDIGNNLGTPVCSPFSGKVSKVDSSMSSTYGLQVEVTAGGAVYKFAHLSSIAVSPGQNVTPGTLLGKMGATGGDWGVHLHYSRANTATGRFYNYPAGASSILLTHHQGMPSYEESCCIFGEFAQ